MSNSPEPLEAATGPSGRAPQEEPAGRPSSYPPGLEQRRPDSIAPVRRFPLLPEYRAAAELWLDPEQDTAPVTPLDAACTVYDCMDELSNFRFAPADLRRNEADLMAAADVVFTGGHSLYEAKRVQHDNIHPFPSSVDARHFAQARAAQAEKKDWERWVKEIER